MKSADFLCKEAMCVDLKSTNKEDVISDLVELLINAGKLDKKDKKKVLEVLIAREALGSTAIGQGIAIPHGKSGSVDKLIGCLGISKQGVNFDSLDGEPSHIFFLLVAPIDSAGPHLKALARISRLLKDKFVRDSLKNVETEEAMMEIIQQEDERLANL
ncbi:PTS sugar transporter subunit IIA [Candidatus Omnitrophota bacterium]